MDHKRARRWHFGARVGSVFCLLMLILAGVPSGLFAQQQPALTIIYVDASASGGNNDGTSWANAYLHLQDALDRAHAYLHLQDAPDEANSTLGMYYEIWVAQGVYYPDEDSDGDHVNDSRDESFTLYHNNVRLYGGFQGTETRRSERDPTSYVTVLSGDIDKNDVNTDGNHIAEHWSDIQGDNAYHVLRLDGVTNGPITAQTGLSALVITAGDASGAVYPDNLGGGLYCDGGSLGGECSPRLTLLTFQGNRARNGGGMAVDASEDGCSRPTLMEVTFRGNHALYNGGGFHIITTGGAGTESEVMMMDATFRENSADRGGGLSVMALNEGKATLRLANIIFEDNRANLEGGGIYGYARDGATWGGTLQNALITDNRAQNGGGVYTGATTSGWATPRFENATIVGNTAEESGGGVYNWGGSGTAITTFEHSILWGNTATQEGSQMYNRIQTMASIVDSLVQDGCPANMICNDVITADPRFVDVANRDLRLRADSPAVDAGSAETNITDVCDLDGDGDTDEPVPYDLVRNPRAVDADGDGVAQIDLGAYELQVSLLNIIKEGEGLVTSTPDRIDCGSVCTGQFANGTAVTLSATADPGWTFAGWSGDIDSTENPLALTMDGDKTLTATFERETYVITPTAGTGGTITPSTPQTVDHADDITFTIAANSGYRIADVVVDGVSQGPISKYTFSNVTADHTISAAFVPGVAPDITSADQATFVIGTDETFTVKATGDPTPTITLSGTLSGGVSFTDNGDGTATLSGTPAIGSAGVYPLTFTASNGVEPDATQAFELTVKARVYLPLTLRSP